MKIALLGATGESGIEFAKEALERGHDVLALVRNPGKLDLQHEKLRHARYYPENPISYRVPKDRGVTLVRRMIPGNMLKKMGHSVFNMIQKANIFDENDLAQSLKGCDAVVSCLGGGKAFTRRETTFYQDTMKPIVAAMRKAEIKRITCISSWCTAREGDSYLKMYEWFYKPIMLGSIFRSMAVMETYLQNECSDIDYTVARAPILKSGPSKGKKILAEEAQFIKMRAIMPDIPRRDVAKFMLDCLENGEWKQKCVAIALS